MGAGGLVKKEDFQHITDMDVKLNILFDTMLSVKQVVCEHKDKSCKEIIEINKKLSKKKKADAATTFAGGFFGGVLAVIGKTIFWKP